MGHCAPLAPKVAPVLRDKDLCKQDSILREEEPVVIGTMS